ncbi:hypothetical protein [Sediminibacter sp. Hel_I_10]|uniref:hypothetical protein n=1 Tax=Sediminibacter sp. Hel_I_10 TaxID=1392490 RepID=UPI00047D7BF3|nr:hypothetical protein [Sediminibacter sp. Hel_I_10]
MKRLTLLVIILFISITTQAQTYKTDITKNAQTYYQYLTDQNFDGILDYMYPRVFELAPRQDMKAGMQQMFNSPDMQIEFLSNTVNRVTDSVQVDGLTYAIVFYNSKMKMTFVSEQNKPEADQKGFLDFMKTTMDSQFGAGNVTSDLENMSLTINMDANMFAIKDPQYDGWKFIGNDDAMKKLVDSIIPLSVRTNLLKEKL